MATMVERLSKGISPLRGVSRTTSQTKTFTASPSIDSPITALRGVNASIAAKLAKLGVKTIHDLLYLFPRRHNNFADIKPIAELEPGKEQTIVAIVWQASEKLLGRRMRSTEAVVGDDTGNIRIIWFNQPYLAKRLRPNTRIVLSGLVNLFRGQKVMESPEYELLESQEFQDLIHTGRLVPVYPLTEGLYPRTLRRLMKMVVGLWAPRVQDFLPEETRLSAGLMKLPEAIKQYHYPDDEALRDKAKRRLAFDELFLIALGGLFKRWEWQEGQPGNPIKVDQGCRQAFLASLPFTLTSAQERVLTEILNDLSQPKAMSRLLQGEVGSGKTVVATAALLMAVASGYQSVLMAPTEILAEQHYKTICQLLNNENQIPEGRIAFPYLRSHPEVRIGLLTGSTKKSEREAVYQGAATGEVDIVIGTHALIQEALEFRRLGLAVIDEQHRFGVTQRSALRQKGFNPHVLVMTATPIPRTLALTLYGDLDLSTIDELPPGRQEIKTKWLSPTQRRAAYNFIRQQIQTGRQAFIICPLIDESGSIEAKAAVAEYQRLSQQVFLDLRLGLLHGRMSAAEKDRVMQQFRAGDLNILVSTPVVEVGIDVPNATVMLVEGADRFGLSQLHQFRGRVGRGKAQSYCLLLAESPSAEGRERLSLIEKTQNGFQLAEADLELRGPGEFFGIRQSGLPDLRVATLSDLGLIKLAREEAERLFSRSPGLQASEHQQLLKEVKKLWQGGAGDLS